MADVVARVVAWHNRHPLARRITPADVSGVGIVALPFALREGEGADLGPMRPVFGHDWMFRVAPRRLHAWVRRHGRYPLPECGDWPLRQIDADLPLAHQADAAGLTGRTLRHAITAVVDADGRRSRVLVAPQTGARRAAVFGRRQWSAPRLGATGALATTLLAAALGLRAPPAAHLPPVPELSGTVAVGTVAAAPAALPDDVPAAVPAPDDGPEDAVHRTTAAPALASASEPVAEPTAAPPAEIVRPVDVPVTLSSRAQGAAPLVALRPRLGEDERRAARVAAEAVRLTSQPGSGAPAASAPTGPVYAIATLPARTRDDAQAQQAALQGLLARTATPMPTKLDLMQAQGRWRVVWWPHPQRAQAEELLLAARARGLKVELIAF